MILGLDFDNTLIRYDELFFQLAFEKGLIPAHLPKFKNTIRDYLRLKNKEDEWTKIQGEVYGCRIQEAPPFEGMLEALKKIYPKSESMYLVSHKTITPYLGPKFDLHLAAREWLREQSFFDLESLGWKENQVYFELTKEKKIQRIVQLGCTHFIDDLPEILGMLPDKVQKILFAPNKTETFPKEWILLERWSEFPALLFS